MEWGFDLLGKVPSKASHPFYQCSEFYVYKDLALFKSGGKALTFPKYTYITENHFHRVWCMTTYRRLKNIVVTLEWVPQKGKLATVTATDYEGEQGTFRLTPEQKTQIKRCFDMLDYDKRGALSQSEFAEFLNLLEVPISGAIEFEKLFSAVDLDHDGRISLLELESMLEKQTHNQVQSGRYFVALSLEEAEAIRGMMHKREGRALLPDSDAAIGLRLGDVMLDVSHGFTPAPLLQQITQHQVFRFIDSELHYTQQQTTVLLRAIQGNAPDARATFFNEVRSCRRRIQNDVKDTAVGKVILTQHEYLLLEFKTLIAVVRARIRKKRMRLLDAFRAFDYNRDGMLSCSELYGGLDWLGLDLQPTDIWAIMLQVDKTKEGRLTWADFEEAFADDETNLAIQLEQQSAPSKEEVFERVVVMPKPIKELYEEAARERRASEIKEIKQEALKEIKVR
jgi:Ca2+-binding EF-hand superfamily protein